MSAPAVAVSKDGKSLAAAWMDHRTRKGEADVHWTEWKRDAFGDDSRIHDDGTGLQNHPALAIDSSGAVWAAWEDNRTGKQEIRARRLSGGGKEVRVSDPAAGLPSFPALAAGPDFVALVHETSLEGVESVVFRRLD